MTIVEKMQTILDFRATRHYVVFVLSHPDADAYREEIGRLTGNAPPRDGHWLFAHVPVVPADVLRSYIVGGWEEPRIDML